MTEAAGGPRSDWENRVTGNAFWKMGGTLAGSEPFAGPRRGPGSLNRRQLLIGASSAAVGLSLGGARADTASGAWDLIIIGGGTAGLPAAIFAARRGARVLVIEAAPQIGGTLFFSTGQMSAAGTRLQAQKGIADNADLHFDDVMRISKGTADRDLVRLAVDHAAETFDWLVDLGLEPLPEHPVLGEAHEPYSQKRYVWAENGGLDVLRVIEPLARAEEARGNLTFRRATRARELLIRGGSVIGARVEDDGGKKADLFASAVLLASGGYCANPALFFELSGYKQYGLASYPFCKGDGHLMALAAGGYTRGKENYICGAPRILASTDEPAAPETRFITRPEKRLPWEIQVNVHGKRYLAEDNPSVDAREHALLRQPDLRTWLIYDQAIFDTAPVGIDGWTREDFDRAFQQHPVFYKADTLAALAEASGVDPKGLNETVLRYNRAQATGVDPDFHRTHMPLPIERPPFYAIRQQAFSITSTVGVAVDDSLQVIREDGTPIGGLYAAGEILGSGQLMGKAAVGGMMVTPALTLGRLLGQSMLPLKT
jgi:fumarate reductase flavoprotein subunit